MTPAEIVDLAKRTARMGTPGNNADVVALDGLKYLNNRAFQIWRKRAWDWNTEAISLSVSSSSYEHTLASDIGAVVVLKPRGYQKPLRKWSLREYLAWNGSTELTQAGVLVGYVHLGRDSSKNIKLRFFSPPSTAVTVEGWGKKRWTKLTTADWSTEIPYFPDEYQDLLFSFLMADLLEQKGDANAAAKLRKAEMDLEEMAGQDAADPDDEDSSPPPDLIAFTARNRGRGTRVV